MPREPIEPAASVATAAARSWFRSCSLAVNAVAQPASAAAEATSLTDSDCKVCSSGKYARHAFEIAPCLTAIAASRRALNLSCAEDIAALQISVAVGIFGIIA